MVFFIRCLGKVHTFLGTSVKLRKVVASFAIAVRSSVRIEQLGSRWTDFHEMWYLSIFS